MNVTSYVKHVAVHAYFYLQKAAYPPFANHKATVFETKKKHLDDAETIQYKFTEILRNLKTNFTRHQRVNNRNKFDQSLVTNSKEDKILR